MKDSNSAKLHKQNFLETNTEYRETSAEIADVVSSQFHEIDPLEDEVWFLQCPKGTDPTLLQGHKLKLPGRTNLSDVETVAVEASIMKQQAFGYCNRKGRYALRLLPIKGNIVLRQRLKANEAVTPDQIDALCPPMGQVPLPSIKVRHPLLGAQFEPRLQLSKTIANRLKRADEESLQLVRESFLSKQKVTIKTEGAVRAKDTNSGVHENASSAGPERKRKRNLSERATLPNLKSKSTKVSNKFDMKEEEDLQWIKQL